MGVMREIDTQADDTPACNETIIDELVSFDRFRGRYPHITPEVLGPDMHGRLVRRTQRILHIGDSVAAAETPYRYIRLRAAEAVQTAEIFADSASDEVRSNPNFSGSFMPILRSLGIAACMLDSAHDAPRDYARGKMVLPPRARFRAQMLGVSLARTVPNIPVAMHAPVAREMLGAASIMKRRASFLAGD
jgi:hypothetical protein